MAGALINPISPVLGANPPGVNKVYAANVEDIVSIPAMTNAYEVDTDIVMASGRKFVLLGETPEDTDVKSEQNGEDESLHITHTLKCMIKAQAETHKPANEMIGAHCVILLKRTDGTVRLMGDIENYCKITKFSENSGKKGSNDRKVYELEVVSTGHKFFPPMYTATLDNVI